MKTVDVFGESRYLKKNYQKWINKLTNVNHMKSGKVFFLGKKNDPNLDDNINGIDRNFYISIN